MSKTKSRSDEEWLRIITESRQSGLSDNVWCEQNGVVLSSFYNAVNRLRKKACTIPVSSRTGNHTMDLTTSGQDVVQIDLQEDPVDTSVMQAQPALYLDNPYKIELTAGNVHLKICNDADISLLGQMLRMLGVGSC